MARKARRTRPSRARKSAARGSVSGVGFLLSRAHQGFRARMAAALEGSGLHLGQVAILGVLTRTNDLSQKRLTQLTGIEKSSMVIFIDNLEKQGWVQRLEHPSDRRAYLVHLTDEALSRLAPIGKRLQEAEAHNLQVLTSEEQMTLASLLARLAEHVTGEGEPP